MRVELTRDEMEVAAMVGVKRRAESKTSGRKDRPSFDGRTGHWDADIEGAAAEMAYCKAMGKYWSCHVNSFKGADQGARVQIRHTVRDDGSLIVRQADPDDHYYVLVTGRAPVFDIVGWITGKDAKNLKFAKNPDKLGVAYFVPQSELMGRKRAAQG